MSWLSYPNAEMLTAHSWPEHASEHAVPATEYAWGRTTRASGTRRTDAAQHAFSTPEHARRPSCAVPFPSARPSRISTRRYAFPASWCYATW